MDMSESPDHQPRTSATGSPDPAAAGSVTRRAALGAVSATPFLQGCGEESKAAADADMFHARFRQAGRGAIARPLLDKVREIVSVKDFGAIGDGVADDTAAIQAAFSSGARKVTFPPGRYMTGPLKLPDWLHIQGEAYQPSIGAEGRATELCFRLRSGAGLTCGLNPLIQNLFFQNLGGSYDRRTEGVSGTDAQAVLLSENAVIEDCCFSLWNECIRTGASTYYLKTSRLHFNRCGYGYRAVSDAPYNIHIDAPHSVQTKVFIAGRASCAPRNVKVFGGSIEGYEAIARYVFDISFFGTYFETEAPRTKVIAIAPGMNMASVALFGCLIYLDNTARFVDMSGLSDAMLTSVGNVYDGIGEAKGICLCLPASGSATLSGDRFGNRHPNDCLYVDTIASAGRFNITFPSLPSTHLQAAYSSVQMVGPRGVVMSGLADEPANMAVGMTVMADGTRWDPLNRRAGRPYWALWQGDRWGALSG